MNIITCIIIPPLCSTRTFTSTISINASRSRRKPPQTAARHLFPRSFHPRPYLASGSSNYPRRKFSKKSPAVRFPAGVGDAPDARLFPELTTRPRSMLRALSLTCARFGSANASNAVGSFANGISLDGVAPATVACFSVLCESSERPSGPTSVFILAGAVKYGLCVSATASYGARYGTDAADSVDSAYLASPSDNGCRGGESTAHSPRASSSVPLAGVDAAAAAASAHPMTSSSAAHCSRASPLSSSRSEEIRRSKA